MKKLQDYAKFYIGCPVVVMDLDGQTFEDHIEYVYRDRSGNGLSIYEWGNIPFDEIDEHCQHMQLKLRPLSSMTEEEKKEIEKLSKGEYLIEPSIEHNIWTPDEFIYLLSKHFDLFQLIESGLAIEIKK